MECIVPNNASDTSLMECIVPNNASDTSLLPLFLPEHRDLADPGPVLVEVENTDSREDAIVVRSCCTAARQLIQMCPMTYNVRVT